MKKILNKIKQLYNYFDTNYYKIILVFLIVLNIAPVLAPLLTAAGLTPVAQAIYWVYSFFCHQLDWRSLHVFDYQYAWCVRDTFIWLNILVAALLALKYRIKPLKWYWLIIFVIPIALDGGIQTIATVLGLFNSQPEYISTNFTRMLTGSIFGMGFGFWIMPSMWEASGLIDARKNLKLGLKKLFVIIFSLNLILYISLVQIWDVTSRVNKPSNFLDYSVKTPTNSADWFTRRRHGL